MPFYEYQCSNCGHTLEELQKMSDEPLKKCPECGKNSLQRLIGTGGGLIFKGSGFYLTDYKKKSHSERKTDKSGKTESKDTSSADNKSTAASGGTKPADKPLTAKKEKNK